MESKTKNRKTREQLDKMAARAFGLGIAPGADAATELKEGWFNAAYDIRLADGREAVLKIAPPKGAETLAYERNIMETEVSTMRLVGENPAIPAPEVCFYDRTHEICDSDYFFMEKLAGDNYENVRDSLQPGTRAEIDFNIGKIVREINLYSGSYYGYPGNKALQGGSWKEAFLKMVDAALEDGLRRNVDYGYGYDEIRDAVSKHAPSLDEVVAPRLVHWDAWDSNVYVKDGRISGLLDFERALWGDPLMEAQFRVFGYGDLEETDSMRGYGKTSFSSDETRRCRLYTLYLGLLMNTECYYRLYEDDSILELSYTLLNPSMDWLKAR